VVVEVFVLSSVLAASSRRCGVGEHVFSTTHGKDPITVSGSRESSALFSATLEQALAKDFSLIPDVHYVCVDRADKNLLVWIALDHPDVANREKVFQKQFALIDGFPEVSFDFNVISSQAADPKDFASDAKLLYSRS
jgi:hypothetical protein